MTWSAILLPTAPGESAGHVRINCHFRNRNIKPRVGYPRTPRNGGRRSETPYYKDNEGILLPVPISSGHYPRKRIARLFSLLIQEWELSCEAVIKGKAMRALIDMGAFVYLIREEVKL